MVHIDDVSNYNYFLISYYTRNERMYSYYTRVPRII